MSFFYGISLLTSSWLLGVYSAKFFSLGLQSFHSNKLIRDEFRKYYSFPLWYLLKITKNVYKKPRDVASITATAYKQALSVYSIVANVYLVRTGNESKCVIICWPHSIL